MYAAANNHVETGRLLLDKGADVNANSALGETALIKALKHGDPDIELVKLLVAAGTDINAATSDGKTALSLAIGKKRAEVVAFLRQAGAR
jgi:ankyrin repeat protein